MDEKKQITKELELFLPRAIVSNVIHGYLAFSKKRPRQFRVAKNTRVRRCRVHPETPLRRDKSCFKCIRVCELHPSIVLRKNGNCTYCIKDVKWNTTLVCEKCRNTANISLRCKTHNEFCQLCQHHVGKEYYHEHCDECEILLDPCSDHECDERWW